MGLRELGKQAANLSQQSTAILLSINCLTSTKPVDASYPDVFAISGQGSMDVLIDNMLYAG